MKNSNTIVLACAMYFVVTGCKLKPEKLPIHFIKPSKSVAVIQLVDSALIADSDPGIVWNRPQVPILCYHQIREWRSTDSKRAKDYIVPVNDFREEMKMLSDSGYHAILPDALIAYLVSGKPLPSRPVMLTFDDTDISQFTVAAAEMKRHGFKGVFFIMTVSLGRPGYMSSEQVKQLSDEGHIIGSHTWDHHNVKQYRKEDWVKQIEKPTLQLQTITGKPIQYFAYPFGLWDSSVIPELKNRGFAAAFQLSTKRDERSPLFTIRRMIVPGYWNAATMHRSMRNLF